MIDHHGSVFLLLTILGHEKHSAAATTASVDERGRRPRDGIEEEQEDRGEEKTNLGEGQEGGDEREEEKQQQNKAQADGLQLPAATTQTEEKKKKKKKKKKNKL